MDDSVSVVSIYGSSVVALVPFLVPSSSDANWVHVLLEVRCSSWRVTTLAVPGDNGVSSNTETDLLSLRPHELCELV